MSTIYKQGKIRADKIKFKTGIGCCIWYPLSKTGADEDMGVCFDFSFADIDDFIAILHILKKAEPDIYDYKTKTIKKTKQPK
jgi:hypothetical protein